MKTELKHFEVSRADDCIWLTDKRCQNVCIHFIPKQAKEVAGALMKIASEKRG